MTTHKVVSMSEWVDARKRLLAKEKEFTRTRDQLSAERRALPWVRIDKEYTFDGPDGRETLAQLFGDRGQLVVYHFMFAPEWEVGCKSCSFWADNFNGITAHLRQRDVAFAAISRAPLPKLQAFAKRLGWTFKWVSSNDTDFNYEWCWRSVSRCGLVNFLRRQTPDARRQTPDARRQTPHATRHTPLEYEAEWPGPAEVGPARSRPGCRGRSYRGRRRWR